MQRMRFPPAQMMGPGVPNGPQKVPVSHPSQQHAAGSPAGMWNNMGSGSPNPNGMQMPQQSVGSPRTPGDQNHGSPMMQQSMRSQTPGMNPVPNSQGMGQPRMGGPQGNMGPMNSRMSMMPQHQNMMHQMHPGQQQGQQQPPQQPQPPPPVPPQQQNPQGQSSPARASPMSHASPMGVNHPSPHMQSHMASPSMQQQQHMHMNQQHQHQQQQQQQQN